MTLDVTNATLIVTVKQTIMILFIIIGNGLILSDLLYWLPNIPKPYLLRNNNEGRVDVRTIMTQLHFSAKIYPVSL